MKGLFAMSFAVLLTLCEAGCAVSSNPPQELVEHKLHHVVVVWLKQAGDAELRRQYIEESESLARLPGVLAYDVGVPAAINRGHANPAVDESYDLAVSAVYPSQQAYETFLKDPEYLRVAQQVLRPLVAKYKVYDFIE